MANEHNLEQMGEVARRNKEKIEKLTTIALQEEKPLELEPALEGIL